MPSSQEYDSDKESVADKQCLEEGKLSLQIGRDRGISLTLFRQIRLDEGKQCKTLEDRAR